ncbi:MAG: GxxExxY protein [Bacteroidota bacterium]
MESVSRTDMSHFVESNGILTETEAKLSIPFRGVKLESGLRLDMPVDHCVIVEFHSMRHKC